MAEDSEHGSISCHLYRQGPTTRLENELRELTGTSLSDETALDALELNAIDSMHYLGQAGSEAIIKHVTQNLQSLPPSPNSEALGGAGVQLLDLGSGFGGCARYVATRMAQELSSSSKAHVTALEIQEDISAVAERLTQRSGLATSSSSSSGTAGHQAEVAHVSGDVGEPSLVLPFSGR